MCRGPHFPAEKLLPPSLPRSPVIRRLVTWPVVATLLVLFAGAFAVSPVRDAATGAAPFEAHLVPPLGYLALAPVSIGLDTLSLLGVGQHIALVLWAVGLYAAWRYFRPSGS